MAFGTEVLSIFALGVLLLGPKRMAAVLGHLARAKAQIEQATGDLKAQLDTEVESTSGGGTGTSCPKAAGEQ